MTSQPFDALARRLEQAQAQQNERFNQAAGGRSLAVGGGFAHLRGVGHPLNQALGLVDPISDAELDAVEAFLGAPTVLELCPAADPALWRQLAARGYRLQQFQQLWTRALAQADDEHDSAHRGHDGPDGRDGRDGPDGRDGRERPDGHGAPGQLGAAGAARSSVASGAPGVLGVPATDAVQLRLAVPAEAELLGQLVYAGFTERDDWQQIEPPFTTSLDVAQVWGVLAHVDGELAGGATLGIVDGVALLSGDAVLPRFRGRGLQRAMIRHRLAIARAHHCDIACASTAPGTASQRSYEACGFRAAYPKVEMARG